MENKYYKDKIKEMKKMVDIQGQDGNWNNSEYMLGMYNGMELMLATIEDREPNYKVLEDNNGTTN